MSDGSNTYEYDPFNRLSKVVTGNDTYEFSYDGQGNRVGQAVNGNWTYYDLDLNAGLTTVLTAQDEDYLYGLGSTPLAQNDPGDIDYLFTDGLGSVRQVVRGDSYGQVTLTESYDPFGNLLSSLGTGASAFGFAGQWQDGSGLMNMRARFYDPSDGRFLTQDSWTGDDSDPMSQNSWNYVDADPINFIDPSGHIKQGFDAQTADHYLDLLKAIYNINITRDWGDIPNVYIPEPGEQEQCVWQEGNWQSYLELEKLYKAVNTISPGKMSIEKFQSAFGSVMIKRSNSENGSFSPPPPVDDLVMGADIILTNNTMDYPDERYTIGAIIHEFGHVWDYRSNSRLSLGLIAKLNTWHCPGDICDWDPYNLQLDPRTGRMVYPEPAPDTPNGCPAGPLNKYTNDFPQCQKAPYSATYGQAGAWFTGPGAEDWADSFATYVYPPFAVVQSWRGLHPMDKRYKYVVQKINEIH